MERNIRLIRRHAERCKASAVARSRGNDTVPARATQGTHRPRRPLLTLWSACATRPHPLVQLLGKKPPLTHAFVRTSFRRFVFRGSQKKHTICQPSCVAVAFGVVNPTPDLK